jgi:hypothetical protein
MASLRRSLTMAVAVLAGVTLGSASAPAAWTTSTNAERMPDVGDTATIAPSVVIPGPAVGLPPAISAPVAHHVPGGTYYVVMHEPQPADTDIAPATVGQGNCLLGTVGGQHGGANAYYTGSNVTGVEGRVAYIRNLYPCYDSGGIYPSDTWVLPANIEGSGDQIQQVQYGDFDGGGLQYELTYSDNSNGDWAAWLDHNFRPVVGHSVLFAINSIPYGSGYAWYNDIYDLTSGQEEFIETGATWHVGGHVWWGFETDNSNCVLGVPSGPPYIDIYNWEYQTAGTTWHYTYNLPFSLWRPDWTFYHGGLVNTVNTHDTVVAWTTAH